VHLTMRATYPPDNIIGSYYVVVDSTVCEAKTNLTNEFLPVDYYHARARVLPNYITENDSLATAWGKHSQYVLVGIPCLVYIVGQLALVRVLNYHFRLHRVIKISEAQCLTLSVSSTVGTYER
jgi:hypothetical protein